MTDYLLKFAQNPLARRVVKNLGLPVPMPQRLERLDEGWGALPLRDKAVVVGGPSGTQHAELASALISGGARVHVADEAVAEPYLAAGNQHDRPAAVAEPGQGLSPWALVFDATGITTVAELGALYEFFHPWISKVGRSGRVLVLGTAPRVDGRPEQEAASEALIGFVKSVGKELGRKGATATLLRVAPDAGPRLDAALRFLLSPRSAFVSGQSLTIDTTVHGDAVRTPSAFEHALADRVALVTGAARGIGASIARCLAREGAKVICLDRPGDDGALDRVADEVGGWALHLDLLETPAPQAIADFVEEHGGSLSVVVHNAGITRDKTLARMRPEAWDQTLSINLGAMTRVTPVLLERCMKNEARIVCLSSIGGIAGNYGQTNYAASKAGVIGYVRTLAPKIAARGIAINAVAPGFIETRMTAAMPVAIREAGRRFNALSQGGLPVDVAEVVTFLASPGAVGITGQTLRVCGLNNIGA